MVETSFELLLTATAIGIAAWTQVVDQPTEQIRTFENKWYRFFSALLLFFSIFIIFLVLAVMLWAVGRYSKSLGAGGMGFYLVLLAVTLASIPTMGEVFRTILKEAKTFNRKELITAFISLIIFGALVFSLVTFGL